MKKPIFFLLLLPPVMESQIVNANDIPLNVELNSCIQLSDDLSKNDIDEMVISLYLETKANKTIYGSEKLKDNTLKTKVTSHAISHIDKSLLSNIKSVRINGKGYRCYTQE